MNSNIVSNALDTTAFLTWLIGIVSIFVIIIFIYTCFAIISIQKSLKDISDTYCKLNEEKLREIKNQKPAMEESSNSQS